MMMLNSKGLTLVEVALVILLMGIVAIGVTVLMPNVIPNAHEQTARARGEAIFVAKQSYKTQIQNAAQNWSSASNDAQRFLLIRSFLPGATNQTLAQFSYRGYTFGLGNTLDEPVTVFDPDGNPI